MVIIDDDDEVTVLYTQDREGVWKGEGNILLSVACLARSSPLVPCTRVVKASVSWPWANYYWKISKRGIKYTNKAEEKKRQILKEI